MELDFVACYASLLLRLSGANESFHDAVVHLYQHEKVEQESDRFKVLLWGKAIRHQVAPVEGSIYICDSSTTRLWQLAVQSQPAGG